MDQSPVNFIPDDYLQKKSQNRSNLICIGLFFVVMGGIGGAVLFDTQSYDRLLAREHQVDMKMRQQEHEIQQLNSMERQKRQMEKRIRIVAALLERRQRAQLLYDIVQLLPHGVAMQKLVLNTNPVKLHLTALQKAQRALARKQKKKVPHRVIIRRVTLRITGVASTQSKAAAFYARLGHCGLFSRVVPLYTEQFLYRKTVVQRFAVRLVLRMRPKLRSVPKRRSLAMAAAHEEAPL